MHHQLTWKQLMIQQANKGSIPLQSACTCACTLGLQRCSLLAPPVFVPTSAPPALAVFLLSTLLIWPVAMTTDRHCWKGFLGDRTEEGLARSDLIAPPPPSVCSELRLGPSSSLPPAGQWGGGGRFSSHSSSSPPLFDLLFHLFLIPLHFFDVPTVNTRNHQSKTSLWLPWLDTVATATQPGAQDRKHVSRWRWVAQDASGGDRWRC